MPSQSLIVVRRRVVTSGCRSAAGLAQQPPAGPGTETVNLSTDADLATFVARLLDLNDGEREELRSGRKRFRLAAAPSGTGSAGGPAAVPGPVRRVERGAVTEEIVNQAARAGQRLVLGRGAVLTPLAKDRARASGVEICKER